MRRALIVTLVLTAASAGALSASGVGPDEDSTTYRIVYDSAFGLVDGADFKVGGVVVGKVDTLDVRREDARAVVAVRVEDKGFGGLQRDARCSIQPQSLIGEYFVECLPGDDPEQLPSGGTVPVGQTASPIPVDLVANVMRRPYRERFAIFFSELGIGLAARGDDVNQTIRRALPALQETDRVLRILADNRRTLRALTRESGQVLKVLGRRRRDVGRFVTEANAAATVSARRRVELAEIFRRFPGFLDELSPTMAALGSASSELAPTLADLRAAAPSLRDLLQTLRPFSGALDPAVASLGRASLKGRPAAQEARSLVKLLGSLGEQSPELAKNTSLVLTDLDDRSRAVEPDPDSPGGAGYTGFEALLQYVFDQSMGINVFDQRGYLLKIDALINECTEFTDAEEAKADPERYKRCGQPLGPTQPGINTPDPSPPAAPPAKASPPAGSELMDFLFAP